MSIERFKKKILAIFDEEIKQLELLAENHISINLPKNHLPSSCKRIIQSGARFTTMVGVDEREVSGYFSLHYIFAFDQEGYFLTLKSYLREEEPSYPSVTRELPACDWYEREVYDLLGLKPEGHPNLLPLILHKDWPEEKYPLRKDYPLKEMQAYEESQEFFATSYKGEGVTRIPVGPIHAGIIEPGHFQFGVAGDMILHFDAQLFFKHRGLEKRSEGMTFREGLLLAERICGMCSLSHAVSYAQAIEGLMDLKIPKRAAYLRTMYLEMERLYNHIGVIGDVCSGAGFHLGTTHGARLKEELQQLNEKITGHRFLRGVISLGGIRRDLPEHEFAFIHSRLSEIRKDFRELVNIILDHETTLDRMATTGYLSKSIADRLEVVGPAARASGRKLDLRKSHPYLVYKELDFSTPSYSQCDVLARVHLRIDEVFDSFSMIQQIIERIEKGPVEVPLKEIPPNKIGIGWTESSLGENIHWLMTGPNNRIYRYRVGSAAYTNWPAVAEAVPGNIVPDFPIINKSFELCYACCDR